LREPPAEADASLPAELDQRLAVLERTPARDFDARSWLWMLLLGVVVPVILLALGWRW
jgi:hypothetical protein